MREIARFLDLIHISPHLNAGDIVGGSEGSGLDTSMEEPTMTAIAERQPFYLIAGLDFRNLIWVAMALGLMVFAIVWQDEWLLRYVHVASGVLLTGADILFGFVVGPVVRRLPFEARRAFALRLLPKTLVIMQTIGIMAPTSGWFLAVQYGYLELDYPAFWWVIAALAVATLLAFLGLGIVLPCNVRAYLEMRKENPDPARVQSILRIYFLALACLGVLQVVIVAIMVQFATGL